MQFYRQEKPLILAVGRKFPDSKVLNNALRAVLPKLLKNYQVIHLCGKGNLDASLGSTTGYAQFEYAKSELRDMFALADIVISRAGANSICELLALRKPNILIPLSANASRGDQILNARSFEKQGFSYVLEEENLTSDTLLDAIKQVETNKQVYIDAMAKSKQLDSIDTVIGLINEAAASKSKK